MEEEWTDDLMDVSMSMYMFVYLQASQHAKDEPHVVSVHILTHVHPVHMK